MTLMMPPSPALLTWAGRPVDGGLLHGPHHPDPWADPGVLAYRDPDRLSAGDGPLSLEQFIALAYPRYAFHRWARVLIALLQAIADGELSRLIVTCPSRLGKSLLVSKLFPAYFIYRHPTSSPPLPATPGNWPTPIPGRRGTSTASPAIRSRRIQRRSATG